MTEEGLEAQEKTQEILSTVEPRQYWLREMFSDDGGRLSAFRVMAMIAILSGCGVIVCQALGYSTMDLNTPLAFLFGGVFGGKAAQKFAEEKL